MENNDFFSMADFEVDCNLGAFEIDLSMDSEFDTRYIRPRIRREIKTNMLKYKNAAELAKNIGHSEGMRAFCVVDGSFIFGDFIEAWIVENKLFIENAYISTLSMSQENIDSLKNLMAWGVIKNLNLIISAYFFANERNDLVKYIYEHLDIDDRFQLGVASTHCKTCCLETSDGQYYTIHGSANLRLSSNLEQFCIEEEKDLYDFNVDYNKRICELYGTIKKQLRRNTLWQAAQADGRNTIKA
jgi:hypothetical protein